MQGKEEGGSRVERRGAGWFGSRKQCGKEGGSRLEKREQGRKGKRSEVERKGGDLDGKEGWRRVVRREKQGGKEGWRRVVS